MPHRRPRSRALALTQIQARRRQARFHEGRSRAQPPIRPPRGRTRPTIAQVPESPAIDGSGVARADSRLRACSPAAHPHRVPPSARLREHNAPVPSSRVSPRSGRVAPHLAAPSAWVAPKTSTHLCAIRSNPPLRSSPTPRLSDQKWETHEPETIAVAAFPGPEREPSRAPCRQCRHQAQGGRRRTQPLAIIVGIPRSTAPRRARQDSSRATAVRLPRHHEGKSREAGVRARATVPPHARQPDEQNPERRLVTYGVKTPRLLAGTAMPTLRLSRCCASIGQYLVTLESKGPFPPASPTRRSSW